MEVCAGAAFLASAAVAASALRRADAPRCARRPWWLGPALLLLLLAQNVGVLAQRFGRPLEHYPGQHPGHAQGHASMGPGRRPAQGPGFSNYPSYGEVDEVLGSPCEYDEHCYSMEHTFCLNHKSCECKRGFVPSPAGDRCLATVGVSCSTKYDCSGLGQAGECRQGVCDCGNTYVPSPDGSCVRGALRIDEACELELQCQTLGEGAVCVDARCQCEAGRHAVNDRCIFNRALREPCEETTQCFIGKEYQGVVTCHPGTGTCRCMEHYVEDGNNKCISGGTGMKAALIMTTLGVLVVQCFIVL